MERYLLFAGSIYYPGGGWEDFKDSFPTLDAAGFAGVEFVFNEGKSLCWFHVVDTALRVVALESFEEENNILNLKSHTPEAHAILAHLQKRLAESK